MKKYKLEYIWLDGKKPVPGLRGKTQIKSFEKPPKLSDRPLWGFDGSSTMQAEGKSSDCILKPVALYPDAARKDAYLVLSEVMHPDGTPHPSNARATIKNDPDLWVGFEQDRAREIPDGSGIVSGLRPGTLDFGVGCVGNAVLSFNAIAPLVEIVLAGTERVAGFLQLGCQPLIQFAAQPGARRIIR